MVSPGVHPKTGKFIDIKSALKELPEWIQLSPLEELLYRRVIASRQWQAEQAANPKPLIELTTKHIAAGCRNVPMARTHCTTVSPQGENAGVCFGSVSLMDASLRDASVEHTILRGIANGDPEPGHEIDLNDLFNAYQHDTDKWNLISAAADRGLDAAELVQLSCLLTDRPTYDRLYDEKRLKEFAWLGLVRDGLSLVRPAIQTVAMAIRKQRDLGPRVTDEAPPNSCLGTQLVHYLGTAGDAGQLSLLAQVARAQGKSLWGHGANNVGNRTAEHVAGSLPPAKQVAIGGEASLVGILHGAAADDASCQILGELEHFSGVIPSYGEHNKYVWLTYLDQGRDLAGNGHGLFKLPPVFESRVRLAIDLGEELCPDYLGFQMACQRAGLPPEIIQSRWPSARDFKMPNVDLILPFLVMGSGLLGENFRPTKVAELAPLKSVFTGFFAMWRIVGWILETAINDGTMIRTAPVKE